MLSIFLVLLQLCYLYQFYCYSLKGGYLSLSNVSILQDSDTDDFKNRTKICNLEFLCREVFQKVCLVSVSSISFIFFPFLFIWFVTLLFSNHLYLGPCLPALDKLKRPLYEKHPMAKFSWTVTEDSDTVSLPQLIKKCVLIFYLCMLL